MTQTKRRKTALWKDVWRSIAHSKGRFASILLLMMLGSFALVGLWVAGPDMRATGEAYFGEYSLADLTVMSDYGLDDEDVAAVNKVTGASAIEYGYFKDVTVEGTTEAVRVMSAPEKISQFELVDGRMPEKADEIAIDSGLAGEYAIGDKITVIEKPNALNDECVLTCTEFSVVGHVNSPEIISIVNMGQSTAGTGSLAGYAVAGEGAFDSDVYMTARLTYDDVAGTDPYTNTYRDAVQAHKDELEELLADRPAARLATVKADAQAEIDDGQAEVDDAKQQLADAEQELTDARGELDDAEAELADAKAELDDAAVQLADGQSQIADAEAEIADGAAQIADAESQIASSQAQLDEAALELASGKASLAESRATLDEAKAKLDDAEVELADGKAQLEAGAARIEQNQATLDSAKQQIASYDEGREQITAAKQQIAAYDDGRAQVAAGREQIAQKTAELDAAEATLDANEAQVEAARTALPEAEAGLTSASQTCDGLKVQATQLEEAIAALEGDESEEAQAQKAAYQAQLDAVNAGLQQAQAKQAELEAQIDQMNAAIEAYDSGRAQVAAGREQIAQKTAELDAAEATLDAQADAVEAGRAEIAEKEAYLDSLADTVEAARSQVSSGETALAVAREELAAKQADYDAGMSEYQSGLVTYRQGMATWYAAEAQVRSGQQSYDEGASQLSSARQTLAEKVSELADARSQVADAKETLAEKLSEYNDGLLEYQDGVAEYQSGLAEYEDGLAEYNEKLPDALSDIADGEADLADARERVAKLSTPAYETDTRRETLGSEAYKTYDTVSEIVDSLARVFPVLLYLVAALVTLSTMTRMVQEERINAGTLKALGYPDSDIALKFVVYGSLAGGIGAVLGIILGHTLLPYIVYSAYADAFTLPPIRLVFHPGITLVALVLAGLCSVLPAALAVKGELAEKPARLMLPKPPAGGSKIFLERVTPVWRRLSFTQKVTFRNLFRYKQRMLMTVLGVAGAACMLVAGFGVQHSIAQMGERQFGQIIKYDMIVATTSTATDEQLADVDELLDDDAVASSVPVHYESVTRVAGDNGDKQEITLIVPEEAGSFSDYVELTERKSGDAIELPESGAVISERLADLLGAGVGDTIEFTASDGTSRQVEVAGVCEMYMGHFMFMSREAFEQCYGEDFEKNAAMACLADGSLESVEEHASEFMLLAGVKSVVQNTALESQVNTVVDSLDMIMTVLIIVATLLGIVIMYNLTNLNVSERMRELSTIKVLGFHSNETTMYIYRETILLTILGVLAGYVLGVALHQYILHVVPPDTVMFDPELAAIEFIVPAVVIGAVTVALYFVELRRLSHVDMLEALKSVE